MNPLRGNGYPTPVQIILPSVPDSRAELLAHLETCPGSHLECYGQPKLERLRLAWIERKHHLEALLDMALEAERLGWRDAKGNPVTPLPWKPASTQIADRAAAKKALETKAYRERKKAGELKPNGSPRSENPSPNALRLRAKRARRKRAAA